MSLNRLDTSRVISASLGFKAFPLDTSGIPSNTSHLVTKFCLFLYLVHAYLSHSVPSSYPVFLPPLQPPRLSHLASNSRPFPPSSAAATTSSQRCCPPIHNTHVNQHGIDGKRARFLGPSHACPTNPRPSPPAPPHTLSVTAASHPATTSLPVPRFRLSRPPRHHTLSVTATSH